LKRVALNRLIWTLKGRQRLLSVTAPAFRSVSGQRKVANNQLLGRKLNAEVSAPLILWRRPQNIHLVFSKPNYFFLRGTADDMRALPRR